MAKPMLVALFVLSAAAADAVRVETGLLEGTAAGDVRVYKGVPYAKPPVGDLRWKPPSPPQAWQGVRRAAELGPACVQPLNPSPYGTAAPARLDEDCLYLNIWTAAKAGEKQPVLFWIHGGGHTTGHGGQASYDGSEIARRGAVVVTINYRLGPFGYFSHPLLSRESPDGSSGNYGTLDQIAALGWVRRNIAAFGGDRDRVTVFGESAGSVSTGCLLVSPRAEGLFHRAVLQSGIPVNVSRYVREDAPGGEATEKMGARIAAQLGCETLDCLRRETAEEVLKVASPVGNLAAGNRFLPVVDGDAIPRKPTELFAAGKFRRVPVMAGANADEGTILLGRALAEVQTRESYLAYLRRTFGDLADRLLRYYPARDDSAVRKALADLYGDMAFVAPTRRLSRWIAQAGGRVYLYHFNRVPPTLLGERFGSYHAAEIPYVFRTFGLNLPSDRRPETPAWDRDLSDRMMGAWLRFAATGDPNGGGLPAWSAYDPAKDEVMVFGNRVGMQEALRKTVCDLFDLWAERRAPR